MTTTTESCIRVVTLSVFVAAAWVPVQMRLVGLETVRAQTAEAMYHATATGALTKSAVQEKVEVVRRDEILYLRVFSHAATQPLETALPGSYLHGQDFKPYGLHVVDLNGDGTDEIIAITSEGASVGAYVSVFDVDNGALKALTDQPIGGHQFEIKRQTNGTHQLKCYGKWTDKHSSTLEVYEWNTGKLRGRAVEGPEKSPRQRR